MSDIIYVLCENDFSRLKRVRNSSYADALWFLRRKLQEREQKRETKKEVEKDEF